MPILAKGQRVGSGPDADRWQVVRKLGEGAFAEVYEVKDTRQDADGQTRFAMKLEKRADARSVRQEYKIMKRVVEHCPQVCPVLYGGQYQDRSYMVMQLLGMNLVDLRRGSQGARLEGRQMRQVASSMLDAIQAVHAAGFIHRDIKPANFSLVPNTNTDGSGGEWRLLDFGLARRYLDDNGATLPARAEAAFRGSTTYASVHAHANVDLGRRDDLWSWMYCIVELAEGTLPWRQTDERREGEVGPDAKAAAAAAKQAAIAQPERLVKTTPLAGVLSVISSHLNSLQFADKPDYGLLRQALAGIPDKWSDSPLPPSTTAHLPTVIDLTMHAPATPVPATTPTWLVMPPEGSHTALALANMKEYLTWLRSGVAGGEVERRVADLCALHPADMLAAIAASLGSAVVSTPAASCNALAALMTDVAAYATHAAQLAGQRYVEWQHEQAAAQQEQQLQWQRQLEEQQQAYQQQLGLGQSS